jgi:hypothetical protein
VKPKRRIGRLTVKSGEDAPPRSRKPGQGGPGLSWNRQTRLFRPKDRRVSNEKPRPVGVAARASLQERAYSGRSLSECQQASAGYSQADGSAPSSGV